MPANEAGDTGARDAGSRERHRKIHHAAVLCLLVFAALLGGALASCRSAEPARLQADDASITAAIKAKLAADVDINPFNVDVTTNRGVVTLQGRVQNEDAREKAERYARETDGVQRVVNLVKVGGS
jgi:hyperosmotically inducible protein